MGQANKLVKKVAGLGDVTGKTIQALATIQVPAIPGSLYRQAG
jgi:hypothetical protein